MHDVAGLADELGELAGLQTGAGMPSGPEQLAVPPTGVTQTLKLKVAGGTLAGTGVVKWALPWESVVVVMSRCSLPRTTVTTTVAFGGRSPKSNRTVPLPTV